MIEKPILTLVKDPLDIWGMSIQQLINIYFSLLNDSEFNFLGLKSDKLQFSPTLSPNFDLKNNKFFNLYSEISNEQFNHPNLYHVFKQYNFTHDLIINTDNIDFINIFKKKLADTLSINDSQIKLTYIETNVTLLAHKDDTYFINNTNIHPYMLRIKNAMVTEAALNWNLIGGQSKFRIFHRGQRYENNGIGELSYFNPCKFKHGTTDNVHRLTLTARFFDIDYDTLWNKINNNLEIIKVLGR